MRFCSSRPYISLSSSTRTYPSLQQGHLLYNYFLRLPGWFAFSMSVCDASVSPSYAITTFRNSSGHQGAAFFIGWRTVTFSAAGLECWGSGDDKLHTSLQLVQTDVESKPWRIGFQSRRQEGIAVVVARLLPCGPETRCRVARRGAHQLAADAARIDPGCCLAPGDRGNFPPIRESGELLDEAALTEWLARSCLADDIRYWMPNAAAT